MRRHKPQPSVDVSSRPADARSLDATAVLTAEFEYVAQSAFQANEDRARVTNFYIVSVGSLVAAYPQFADHRRQQPYSDSPLLGIHGIVRHPESDRLDHDDPARAVAHCLVPCDSRHESHQRVRRRLRRRHRPCQCLPVDHRDSAIPVQGAQRLVSARDSSRVVGRMHARRSHPVRRVELWLLDLGMGGRMWHGVFLGPVTAILAIAPVRTRTTMTHELATHRLVLAPCAAPSATQVAY